MHFNKRLSDNGNKAYNALARLAIVTLHTPDHRKRLIQAIRSLSPANPIDLPFLQLHRTVHLLIV